MSSKDARHRALESWAREALMQQWGRDPGVVDSEGLGGDASFRRYFRYVCPQSEPPGGLPSTSLLLVDAPPDRENNPAFLLAAREFRAAGLRTPLVLAHDLEQGFMVIEDFGDQLYLPALQQAKSQQNMARIEFLYQQAMRALLRLQGHAQPSALPAYSRELLERELRLFDEWFCRRMLSLQLDAATQNLLDATWQQLLDNALQQPQVRVHRDYHSRNLMIRQAAAGHCLDDNLDNQPDAGYGDKAPGIIDFQDAVIGPVTYDLVSLLRDCYIVWPPAYVEQWLQDFYAQAQERDLLPAEYTYPQFQRDFDLMGLQRHIKVLGIFCRLYLRDGKQRYLNDLPVVMRYVLEVAERYPQMQAFLSWFKALPLPAMRQRLAELGASSEE